MNIALPILLLVFGGLTFWTLTESTLKWYLKTACISSFCVFTIIFWLSISTFLGWAAHEDDVPDKVLIHWVIIKEPNKFTKFKGKIYVLLEAANEKEPNKFIKFFGYKKDKVEPRLYGLAYSRSLHEQLEKSVIPRLRKGQPVTGKLAKGEPTGEKGKKGNEKGPNNKKGGGSESQEQEWHFHELRPSDFQSKPE